MVIFNSQLGRRVGRRLTTMGFLGVRRVVWMGAIRLCRGIWIVSSIAKCNLSRAMLRIFLDFGFSSDMISSDSITNYAF